MPGLLGGVPGLKTLTFTGAPGAPAGHVPSHTRGPGGVVGAAMPRAASSGQWGHDTGELLLSLSSATPLIR